MNYLADTHTFLWYAEGSALLSPVVRAAIEDPSSTVHLSFASVWEMAIKTAKEGLAGLAVSYPGGFDLWLDTALKQTGFVLYATELRHVKRVAGFTAPVPHNDPFDHLIIAQALVDGLPVIWSDEGFDAYGVTRVW